MIGQVAFSTATARMAAPLCRRASCWTSVAVCRRGQRSASAPRRAPHHPFRSLPVSTCRPCRRPNTRTSRIGNRARVRHQPAGAEKLIDATQFSMATRTCRYYPERHAVRERRTRPAYRGDGRSPAGHLPPRGGWGIAARSSGHPAAQRVLELVRLLEAEDKLRLIGRSNLRAPPYWMVSSSPPSW